MTAIRQRSISRRHSGGAVLAALAFLLCACEEAGEGAPRPRATLEVVGGPLTSHLLLNGTVEAAESAVLVAPNVNIHPLQVRWLAEDGIRVEAGDTVAEFDNALLLLLLEELQTQIDERQTELEVALAQASSTVAEAEFALRTATTERRKAEISASVPAELTPAVEMANLELDLDKARLEESNAVRALEAARTTASADVELKRLTYERTVRERELVAQRIDQLALKAPRNGIVILQENDREDRVFQEGDSTWAGTTLAQLPNLGSLRVSAQLYDVDDGRVAPGMPAEIVLDAFPDEVLKGEVERVDDLARQASRRSRRRVLGVVVSVPELDPNRVLPGMSARLRISRISGDESSPLVPRSAIAWDEAPFTTTRDGQRHDLTLDDCNGTHCLVSEPLEIGAPLRRPEGS
ncbi:MAG: efflux RND transporter periplasmic adaptor subunit [Acidobacteriota bacterium]